MTTLRDRELQTPAPPQHRGPWIAGALLLFVALVAGGMWLLFGGDPEPAPAPAEPALSPAERNAQTQAADVAAATDAIQTYQSYVDRIYEAWDMSAAPLDEVATLAEVSNTSFIIENIAIDDPTYTGQTVVEVNPEPAAWNPGNPRSMTMDACLDVSQSSLTSGGTGADVRILPGGAELPSRYIVSYDMIMRGDTWLVSGVVPTPNPC